MRIFDCYYYNIIERASFKDAIHNEFRIRPVVSGYNFSLKTNDIQYYVTQDGESLEILKKFAEWCNDLRKDHGSRLAEKFGDTPAWFNEKPQLFKDL